MILFHRQDRNPPSAQRCLDQAGDDLAAGLSRDPYQSLEARNGLRVEHQFNPLRPGGFPVPPTPGGTFGRRRFDPQARASPDGDARQGRLPAVRGFA